jgi:hypothetical protein
MISTSPVLCDATQSQEKSLCEIDRGFVPGENGAPGRGRTCDLWFRKPTLYPTELQAHSLFKVKTSLLCFYRSRKKQSGLWRAGAARRLAFRQTFDLLGELLNLLALLHHY